MPYSNNSAYKGKDLSNAGAMTRTEWMIDEWAGSMNNKIKYNVIANKKQFFHAGTMIIILLAITALSHGKWHNNLYVVNSSLLYVAIAPLLLSHLNSLPFHLQETILIYFSLPGLNLLGSKVSGFSQLSGLWWLA